MGDYRALDRSYQLAESGMYPFPICDGCALILRKNGRGNTQSRTCSMSSRMAISTRPSASRFCWEVGIEPEFVNKKCGPVQAADLLAWRTRSAFCREHSSLRLTFDKADSLQATLRPDMKLLPSRNAHLRRGSSVKTLSLRTGSTKAECLTLPLPAAPLPL